MHCQRPGNSYKKHGHQTRQDGQNLRTIASSQSRCLLARLPQTRANLVEDRSSTVGGGELMLHRSVLPLHEELDPTQRQHEEGPPPKTMQANIALFPEARRFTLSDRRCSAPETLERGTCLSLRLRRALVVERQLYAAVDDAFQLLQRHSPALGGEERLHMVLHLRVPRLQQRKQQPQSIALHLPAVVFEQPHCGGGAPAFIESANGTWSGCLMSTICLCNNTVVRDGSALN